MMAAEMLQPPRHPQPGFYETTAVRRGRKKPYTHLDYEAQRDLRFGEIEDLKERATLALLDKGWVPTMDGLLMKPEVQS